MSSRNLADAHSTLQSQYTKAKAAFEKDNKGVEVFLTCSYRSKEEQTSLYNQPFDHKDNVGDGRIDERLPMQKQVNHHIIIILH